MVKDKFKAFLIEIKHTPEEFSLAIGMGKSAVYKILRGDTKKISDKLAKKIYEKFPKYTVSYLKSFNYEKDEMNIIRGTDGNIEVHKIVDIILANYDKFLANENFTTILNNYAKKEILNFLEKKK